MFASPKLSLFNSWHLIFPILSVSTIFQTDGVPGGVGDVRFVGEWRRLRRSWRPSGRRRRRPRSCRQSCSPSSQHGEQNIPEKRKKQKITFRKSYIFFHIPWTFSDFTTTNILEGLLYVTSHKFGQFRNPFSHLFGFTISPPKPWRHLCTNRILSPY